MNHIAEELSKHAADSTEDAAIATSLDRVFPGDGEITRLMRAMDWSRTPLGPVETWSSSLRMMVSFLHANRFPLLLWWGPRFCQLYNDPYKPVLGSKHPMSLGQPASECWAEIWDVIGPLVETPFNGGPATWSDDLYLEPHRHGFAEETHFTVAYSPVPDETAPNGIGGVLATVYEKTEQVVGERRVLSLRDLGARSAEAKTAEEACRIAAETLAQHAKDLPFALLYLIDADGKHARLVATAGVEGSGPLDSGVIALGEASGEDAHSVETNDGTSWPLSEVMRSETVRVVENLTSRFEIVPPGPWSDPPTCAVVAPIRSNIAHQLAGFLVAGVSARLRLDDTYIGFYELVSSQIATAIANARAYEEERQRAEMLAAIDRAKTAFFSNVSHEFRTPLTLMLGPIADSLADVEEPLPPRQHERIEVARRNATRLLKLVNTLLDFSRIEAGRTRAIYEPTDAATYTAELASAFRSLFEKAGLTLAVDCPPLDGLREPVYVDREMWEKIVLNLLSNAFKYTFEGAITVALRAVDGGSGMELEVRDTGVGIPAEELPRLFERFHRVEGARARTHEGSGIGLALVHDLVHLHGGAIHVESLEGVGTSVFVRLPTGAAHLPADHIQARSTLASTALGAISYVQEAERWLPDEPNEEEPASEPRDTSDIAVSAPSQGRLARIVLADDNADMRGYLRRLLSERYHVEAVSNGRAALDAIQLQPPDLVLTDVMMPELDGFGLLAAVRADPRLRAIPVIMLSARAGAEATIEGLQAGADDYLIKPFAAREVLSRVAARLEMARLRTEAVARAQELEGAFEAIVDAAFIYDRDGQIIRVNSAARTLFGLDDLPGYAESSPEQRAQLISARDEHGRPIPMAESGLNRLLRGESLTGANALDVRLHLADGRAIDVNITGAPLVDSNGAITGAIAISRDVTARRRLERQVRESEARLRSVLELLPVGVALVDASGKPEIVNQALKAIWGEDVPYAGSMTDYGEYKGWWPETGKRVQPEEWGLARALTKGEMSLSQEIDIEAYDGRRKTILDSTAPLRDETGAIVGGMSVLVDITGRKLLERRTHDALDALLALTEDLVRIPSSSSERSTETLTEIGARLAGLVRRVFDCEMVVMSTLDPRTGAMQPLAAVGLDPEVEAQWWRDVAVTPLHEYLAPELIARIYERQPVELDLDADPLSNGADYHVHRVLVAPLVLGETIVGLMSIEHTPTARSYTDDDLTLMMAMGRMSALAIERERLIRERTEGEAREMAAIEAKRQMDEFLGIASHELRTPLTSISANVQMAERNLRAALPVELVASDETDGKLRLAHLLMERTIRQVTRLDRLVGDLLDVSRIQAGKLELRIEPGDLLAVTREAVQEQRAAWPDRSVSLDLPRRASVPIQADSDRIGQVITNYLTNALKYSSPDAPVQVTLQRTGAEARVTVCDRGPGLTTEQRAHIWDRFHRVPGIRQQSGSGAGLGLGLYICRTIVERHHGQVGVDSKPGKGSAFWFTVPLPAVA